MKTAESFDIDLGALVTLTNQRGLWRAAVVDQICRAVASDGVSHSGLVGGRRKWRTARMLSWSMKPHFRTVSRLAHLLGYTASDVVDTVGVEVEVGDMVSDAVEATRSRLSYSAIATYAEQIAKQNGVVGQDGAVDVRALLEKLGGQVRVDDRVESLEVRGEGDFTVFVPTHTSRLRDTFTIAHELGHYFLHYRAPERTLVGAPAQSFTRLGRNVSETQANVFASNLLMPKKHFELMWSGEGGEPTGVARHFGVSIPATRVRAEFLGLIT